MRAHGELLHCPCCGKEVYPGSEPCGNCGYGSRFKMGKLVWTRGVNDKIADDSAFSKFVLASLKRYGASDWGEICEEDKTINGDALRQGLRLMGVYEFRRKPKASKQERDVITKIWIITEWDRSVTTVLFPDEY